MDSSMAWPMAWPILAETAAVSMKPGDVFAMEMAIGVRKSGRRTKTRTRRTRRKRRREKRGTAREPPFLLEIVAVATSATATTEVMVMVTAMTGLREKGRKWKPLVTETDPEFFGEVAVVWE